MALARRSGLGVQLGCHPGETGILSAAGRQVASHVRGIRYLEGSYDRHVLAGNLIAEDVTFRYGGRARPLGRAGSGRDRRPRVPRTHDRRPIARSAMTDERIGGGHRGYGSNLDRPPTATRSTSRPSGRPDGPSRKARVLVLHGVQSHGGWYHEPRPDARRVAGYEAHFADRRGSGANRHRPRSHAFDGPIDQADVSEYLATASKRLQPAGARSALAGISWGGKLAVIGRRPRRPDLGRCVRA